MRIEAAASVKKKGLRRIEPVYFKGCGLLRAARNLVETLAELLERNRVERNGNRVVGHFGRRTDVENVRPIGRVGNVVAEVGGQIREDVGHFLRLDEPHEAVQDVFREVAGRVDGILRSARLRRVAEIEIGQVADVRAEAHRGAEDVDALVGSVTADGLSAKESTFGVEDDLKKKRNAARIPADMIRADQGGGEEVAAALLAFVHERLLVFARRGPERAEERHGVGAEAALQGLRCGKPGDGVGRRTLRDVVEGVDVAPLHGPPCFSHILVVCRDVCLLERIQIAQECACSRSVVLVDSAHGQIGRKPVGHQGREEDVAEQWCNHHAEDIERA